MKGEDCLINKNKRHIYVIKYLISSLLIFLTGYISLELKNCVIEKVITNKMLISLIVWIIIYVIYLNLSKKLSLYKYKKNFNDYLLMFFSLIIIYGIAFLMIYILCKFK